jgi:tetratricopeptide (TPR) repeat protein
MSITRISGMLFLLLWVLGPAPALCAQTDEKVQAFAASTNEETAKNYTNAIQIMKTINEKYHSDYLISLRLGWLHYLSKDYESSIRYYQEAEKISDNSIESLLGITYPYAELKKWDQIQDVYNTILSKDKLNYAANLRLGQIYYNRANYVLAKKYFTVLYEQFPSDYETNLYLGWTYYYLGARSKAQFHFVNAMSMNGSDTSALKGWGLTK